MKQLISIGDLIDQSWSQYKKSFGLFLNISGWLILIAILKTITVLLYPSAGVIAFHPTLTFMEKFAVVLAGLTNIVIAPLLGLWIFIALTIGAWSVISQTPASVKDIASQTNKRFAPVLMVTVLVGLTIILAQILTLGPAALLGLLGFLFHANILLVLANIALVVGMIASVLLTARWVLYYALAPYVCILQKTSGKSALLASRRLTEGKFWAVLFRLLLPKIVFVLFGLLAAAIINLLMQAMINGIVGLNLDLQMRLLTLVNTVLPILIAIVLNPLMIISDVLLARNLTEQTS